MERKRKIIIKGGLCISEKVLYTYDRLMYDASDVIKIEGCE